ncbi:DedA family protein [Ancylobacter sp. WKF20]|uniref:DedA family protein n=1 Tax=Ancylobacter sp. WKF20 TaxID=3039801 RepID=UPI0024341A2C|nr:DedA family protein [Ancylobacter sp. WKF20]WGD29617.1 DedA family protein [Ancylobacter sp. WKF20]
MSELHAYAREVLSFVTAHAHYAPYVAFLLAFCESLAIVSLVVPATFVLLGLSPVIAAGGVPLLPVWAATAAGAALGDTVSYWVGFYLKGSARERWPLNRFPQALARGERFFLRFGTFSVFLGRFSGPLRAFVPLVAGMFAMPHFLFQMVNITSAMLWALLILGPGAAAVKALGW